MNEEPNKMIDEIIKESLASRLLMMTVKEMPEKMKEIYLPHILNAAQEYSNTAKTTCVGDTHGK